MLVVTEANAPVAFEHPFDGETRADEFAGGGAHAVAEGGLGGEFDKGVGQQSGRAGGDQAAVVAVDHLLRGAAHGGGDDGQAGGHCFE